MRLKVGVGASALVCAMALPASAGVTPDPRLGDIPLGKLNGVAYVSDSDFAGGAAFVDIGTACPDTPGPWRTTSGGFSLVGGADQTQRVAGSIAADLPDKY